MPKTRISFYTRNSSHKLTKTKLMTLLTSSDRNERILKKTKLIRVRHNRKDKSKFHPDGKTTFTIKSTKREDIKTLISKNALSYLKKFNSKNARAQFYFDSSNVLIVLLTDKEKDYVDRQIAQKLKAKKKLDAKYSALKKENIKHLLEISKMKIDKINELEKRLISNKIRRYESRLATDDIPKTEAYKAIRTKINKSYPIAQSNSVFNPNESGTEESADGSSDEEDHDDEDNSLTETDSGEE